MTRLQSLILIGTLGATVASAYGSLTASATVTAIIQDGGLPTFTAMANATGLTFTYGFLAGFLLAVSAVMFMKWTK